MPRAFILLLAFASTAMGLSDVAVRTCRAAWDQKVARHKRAASSRANLGCSNKEEAKKEAFDIWVPEWSCEDSQRIPVEYKGDGPKWMVGLEAAAALRRGPSLIFSLGSSGNIVWELAMRRLFPNAEIHIVDPTGRGTWYTDELKQRLLAENLTMHEWWASDKPQPGSDLPALTMSDMLTKIGHSNAVIDFLKVDIEGSEWGFFGSSEFKDCSLRFHHLNIELHCWKNGGAWDCNEIQNFFKNMERCGYRIAWKEPNHWSADGWKAVEYTLISTAFACVEFAHSHGCPPCSRWVPTPDNERTLRSIIGFR